jgi:DNA-directed RNA polymerase sigma subunit (sigma70/sigma32)
MTDQPTGRELRALQKTLKKMGLDPPVEPFEPEPLTVEVVERLLAPLAPMEREVLKLRFGLDRGWPRTLDEVGELLGFDARAVMVMERAAMGKLRHPDGR